MPCTVITFPAKVKTGANDEEIQSPEPNPIFLRLGILLSGDIGHGEPCRSDQSLHKRPPLTASPTVFPLLKGSSFEGHIEEGKPRIFASPGALLSCKMGCFQPEQRNALEDWFRILMT